MITSRFLLSPSACSMIQTHLGFIAKADNPATYRLADSLIDTGRIAPSLRRIHTEKCPIPAACCAGCQTTDRDKLIAGRTLAVYPVESSIRPEGSVGTIRFCRFCSDGLSAHQALEVTRTNWPETLLDQRRVALEQAS